MQLHHLHIKLGKKRKRVGRGGKRGTTSGRGQKGQKSRAGRRIRPAERDLIIRLPKRRGFRNKPKRQKPIIFNLASLTDELRVFVSAGGPLPINTAFLKKIGLLGSSHGEVKILGDGDIDFPIAVSGIRVSKNARAKIEHAGGSVRIKT